MSIAQYIDHTLLSPSATKKDISRICREALEFRFKAVCISGCWLQFASETLAGSGVQLAGVVGFPHGNSSTRSKCCEAEAYLNSGAEELDVVLNVGWLKSGEHNKLKRELNLLRETAPKLVLKLILETCYLDDEEKRLACRMAADSGWDFVKTSTGFGPGGAKMTDVLLMKEAVGEALQIKASGGIRDYLTARKFLEAGATRIGASSGPSIVKGEKNNPL